MSSSLVISAEKFKELFPNDPIPSVSNESLRLLVPIAQKFAQPPISNFNVGCAILCDDGNMYLGANVEFKGTTLGQSIHAEQCAVGNAARHGVSKILQLAVSATPCGHCRQFLNEQTNSSSTLEIHCAGENGTWSVARLSELLPNSFGPSHLGIDEPLNMFRGSALSTTELLEQAENAPVRVQFSKQFGESSDSTLTTKAQKLADNPSPSSDISKAAARVAAVVAALKSYAPHSNCQAGIACVLEDGTVVDASYFENAAYNPTLPPLQHLAIGMLDAIPAGESLHDSFKGVTYICLAEGHQGENQNVVHRPSVVAMLESLPLQGALFECVELPSSP